ncbi:hypothetical protein ANOM_006547 [Aspergillus nomiae NRRL 13137]|uniref:DUF7820 domain-containing protein n=1 Tax=Aspergillus nomiae NRRL (strain ATCC 15546 / NRRL 13137 / CBS 260.88 / M93) TaxID=1509407 RepID=A0A0L1J018_ASPN3|nr:uncharacterized protein ANOM_006547 [Aspergillus nomiae NRRL 13137]KNG84985.1 hypothetical protein ANOM_006547 [Aspergillus nomiae NRRL 13137]
MPGRFSSDHSRSLSRSSQSPSQQHNSTQDAESMHQRSMSGHSSNPNVFSDEYSLEQIDSEQATLTPRSPSVSSIASSNTLRSSFPQQQQKLYNTTPNDLGVTENPFGDDARVSFDESPNRSSLPPKGVDFTNRNSASSTSTAPSIAQRSQSTSSRFSMPPRALSPYTGATGPSHPYAMYPQVGVSRSPSIATTSTVRPMERPLGDANAPQHPYAMYPQNVVAEEEMDNAMIPPVGFPGHPQAYQRPPNRADDDVGDLIGPDGHREQLPPYSRYPDPVVPKVEGTFDPTPDAGVTLRDNTHSPNEHPPPPVSEVSSNTLVAENMANRRDNDEERSTAAPVTGVMAFEEKLKSKGKKKACCGLPVWTLVLVGVVMLVGACIGGVIGGVLGAKKAANDENDHPKGPKIVTKTETPRMDATPISTIPTNLPAAPTGNYWILRIRRIHRNFVLLSKITIPQSSRNITFAREPISSSFTYGAQAPYFSNPTQSLSLMMDSSDLSLGPALTFFSLFDKLVIVPQDTFSSSSVSSKRAISEDDVMAGAFHRLQTARAGDKPWFCWWNSTVMEFFLYLNQSTKEAQYSSSSTHLPSSQATDSSSSVSNYPLRIKMDEKRDYPEAQSPYCQQMQVMDDGSVSPILQQTIQIKELEPTPTTTLKYSASATQTYTATAQYEHVCYCVALTD